MISPRSVPALDILFPSYGDNFLSFNRHGAVPDRMVIVIHHQYRATGNQSVDFLHLAAPISKRFVYVWVIPSN